MACAKAFTGPADQPARLGHQTEIELSAFLRLLGTRDAYRRVYQMRAEPLPVLKLLFQNPEAPRSVLHALTNCAALLRVTNQGGGSAAMQRPLSAVERFCERLRRIDWTAHFDRLPELEPEDFPALAAARPVGRGGSAERRALRTRPSQLRASHDRRLRPSARPLPSHGRELSDLLNELLRGTMDLHNDIADVFLNHQAHLSTPLQPFLKGFAHGI